MVETHSGRRFALLFFVAAFLVLFLGHWLSPVNRVALTVAAPFQAALTGVTNTVGDAISGVLDGPRLRDENIQLRKELAQLAHVNNTLQQFKYEDARLTRLLHFEKAHPRLNLEPVNVIGNCPNNTLEPCIYINRGSSDGLRQGMTVVDTSGNFVGAVDDVTGNAASVTIMLNPSLSVAALDEQTRAGGLVVGKYGDRPQLQKVLTRQKLRRGDWIVTSGSYNLFPPGLLMGQVAEVRRSESALFQTAVVQPAADFQDLEIAAVVRNFHPNYPSGLVNQ